MRTLFCREGLGTVGEGYSPCEGVRRPGNELTVVFISPCFVEGYAFRSTIRLMGLRTSCGDLYPLVSTNEGEYHVY